MIKAIHTPMYVANVAVFRRIASSLSSPEIVHSWGANPNSNETRKK